MEDKCWSRRQILALGGSYGWSAMSGNRPHSRLVSSSYRSQVLAKKPVGYWRLGESAGPTAHDETQNGNNGTFHGHIDFGEKGAIIRDVDTAIALNGQDAYIEIPESDKFSQPTSGKGLTVEVWMRPDVLLFEGETQEHYVHWLGKGDTGHFEWGMRFYSKRSSRPNRISAYIWNPDGGLGAGAYFQESVRPGAWLHVVATYSPGDKSDPDAGVSIYRNGVLRGSPRNQNGARYSSYDIVPVHGSAPVRFGTRDFGSFFKGGLDEIAIYPRTLSAEEIGENYRAG